MTTKTPAEVAAEQMSAFTTRDGDVQETSAGYIEAAIAEAIKLDRAQRAKPTSHLPEVLTNIIDWVCDSRDYSIYVLDGQTAECTEKHDPENVGGSCYHDALVIVDGPNGERAMKFVLEPNGSLNTRWI